jgi:hypothetical protein
VRVAPALEPFVKKRYEISMRLTIYVIDGRTFEIAAVSGGYLVQKAVPASWFVEPDQHAVEIKGVLLGLLDKNLGPTLRKLGLPGSGTAV